MQALSRHTLLYVPLVKGGDPHEIVAARTRQRLIQDLLSWLPRLGLIVEACQVVELAREMERQHPVGPGAVTEFDEMFKMGYKSLVRMIVHSAATWTPGRGVRPGEEAGPRTVVECLKQLTESLLSSWLAHSKTLRLSVLEKVKDRQEWAPFGEVCRELRSRPVHRSGSWISPVAHKPAPGRRSVVDAIGRGAGAEVAERLLADLERRQVLAAGSRRGAVGDSGRGRRELRRVPRL